MAGKTDREPPNCPLGHGPMSLNRTSDDNFVGFSLLAVRQAGTTLHLDSTKGVTVDVYECNQCHRLELYAIGVEE